MKLNFYFLITIFVFTFLHTSHAYCNETEEIDCNKLYNKICQILKENTGEDYITTIKYGADTLNYAVEILNKKPTSLEAFLTIFIINDVFDKCERKKIKIIYDNIKDKHILHFDDPDFEPGEKIIFLMMYMTAASANSHQEAKEHQLKVADILQKMKNGCADKSYAALANAVLLWTKNKDKRIEFIKYFIDNFPNHPAIPNVKLLYVSNLYDTDPQTCINEINKLIAQYGKNIMPNGWEFSADCYEELVQCYINLNDSENAMKYYEMIKKEAPRSWNLNEMKEYIDEINIK